MDRFQLPSLWKCFGQNEQETLACSENAEMLDVYGRPYLLDIISVFIEICKGQALSSLLKSQQKMASSHKEHKS